jgi:hypothetical protein
MQRRSTLSLAIACCYLQLRFTPAYSELVADDTPFARESLSHYDEDVQSLIAIVVDESPAPNAPRQVFQAIVELGRMRSRDAVPCLIPWLTIRHEGNGVIIDDIDRHHLYPAAESLVSIGYPARSELAKILQDPGQPNLAKQTAVWCLLEMEGRMRDQNEVELCRDLALVRLTRRFENPQLSEEERASLLESIEYMENYQVAAELMYTPVFVTLLMPNGVVGDKYHEVIQIGPAPENPSDQILSLELADEGALPQGLSLDPDTMTIQGTPEMSGEFTFTVRATSRNDDPQSVYSYDSFRDYTIVIE